MRIELHIGRLVLDSVAAHQGTAIREAVIAELSHLLTTTPDHRWRTSQRRRRIAAPPVPPTAGGAEQMGRGVARSVYTGIASQGRRP